MAKAIGMAAAISALFCCFLILACQATAAAAAPALIFPPQVRVGDTVGFISPASPPLYIYNPATYKSHVVSMMDVLGLKVKWGAHAFDEFGYLAGNDSDRASDVMEMFRDTSVKMIVANRGGWGTNRFINMLDYEVIKRNPKVIMGYSDLTGLLNAIHTKTGLVTFSGPMGIDNWWGANNVSLNGEYAQNVTMNATAPLYVNLPSYPTRTIRAGKARGRLVGGNLSVFSAMSGSDYLLPEDMKGAIMFIEEVGEAPYRIDRMITTLATGHYLDGLAGFVFGVCTACTTSDPAESLSLNQILDEHIRPLGIPAFSGAMFGHELTAQFTLPIGAQAEIDADHGTIRILEKAVRT